MLEEIDDLISMILPDQADNFYYSLGEWHNIDSKQGQNVYLNFEDDYGKKAKWKLLFIWDPKTDSVNLYLPKDKLEDFTTFKRHIGPDGNWNYFDVYDFE